VGRWIGFALVLVLVAACSDDVGSGEALDESLLPGPGTELGGGFVVPEATRLVGPIPSKGDEWVVDLVLDGDPRDAADDVVQQATAAGFGVDAQCSVVPRRTFCSVRGLRTEGEWVLEDVYFQLERSSGGAAYRAGGTYGHTSWPPGANEVGRGVAGLVLDLAPLPRPPLPPADPVPDLPNAGEPIAGPDQLIGPEIVVAEGSEVVVPIQPSRCPTGGFDAHLVITGDVDTVVDAYQTQFEDWGEEEVSRLANAGRVRLSTFDLGGGDITFEVVLGGDPVWATLSRCND
jgi:hypothetical protein